MIAESTVDVWYLMSENDPDGKTCHLQYLPAVENGRCSSAQRFKVFTFLDSADSGPTVRRTPWDWVAGIAHILMNRKQRPSGAQDKTQPSGTNPPLEVHFLQLCSTSHAFKTSPNRAKS